MEDNSAQDQHAVMKRLFEVENATKLPVAHVCLIGDYFAGDYIYPRFIKARSVQTPFSESSLIAHFSDAKFIVLQPFTGEYSMYNAASGDNITAGKIPLLDNFFITAFAVTDYTKSPGLENPELLAVEIKSAGLRNGILNVFTLKTSKIKPVPSECFKGKFDDFFRDFSMSDSGNITIDNRTNTEIWDLKKRKLLQRLDAKKNDDACEIVMMDSDTEIFSNDCGPIFGNRKGTYVVNSYTGKVRIISPEFTRKITQLSPNLFISPADRGLVDIWEKELPRIKPDEYTESKKSLAAHNMK